ncbi:MAG: hypothetical protein MUF78_10185 [Candidatus Edwardsbacteria bacterium]|nr:hypothetical protein [Candidatus Edwardsbacteria bacterium]
MRDAHKQGIDMNRFSLLAAAVIAAFPLLASGQALEQPVSFDAGGRISEWSARMEAQARLFPDIGGFQKALLWRADTALSLEIFTARGRLRRELTVAGFDSLRAGVAAFLHAQGGDLLIDRSGRGTMLWGQLPLSLGWYGPAVVALLDPNDGSTATGLYLLSASASYYVPLAMTAHGQITKAQAGLTLNYGYLGLPVGWAIPGLFSADDYKAYMAAMLVTSIGGQLTGFRLARAMTEPQAALAASYTFFGAAQGTLLALTLQQNVTFQKTSVGILAGTGLGCAAGLLYCRRPGVSAGEPDVITASGVCGGLVGFHAALLLADLDDNTHRPFSGAALAGSAAGLWLGHRLARGYDLSKSDGTIVAGAAAGGYLLGAGIGYLLMPTHSGDDAKVRTLAGATIAGLAGGYALGLSIVRRPANRAVRSSSLEIGINPLGLAALAADRSGRQRIPLVYGRF